MKFSKNSTRFTDMNNSHLNIYMREISRYPLLSTEQTAELFALVAQGGSIGKKASDVLVASNLRFVISMAKHFENYGALLEDLIQVGSDGLMSAVQNFDIERGGKLTSYAVFHIKRNMLRYIEEKAPMVHASREERKRLRHAKQADVRYDDMTNDSALSLGYDGMSHASHMTGATTIVSMDGVGSGQECRSLYDKLYSDEYDADQSIDAESRHSDIMRVLSKLDRAEMRQIICMHFGIDCEKMTNKEIAEVLGISKDTVSRLLNAAIESIRKGPGRELLRNYAA